VPPSSLAELKAAKLAELRELRQEADQRERERAASIDVFGLLRFTPNPGPQTRFLSLPDENIDVLYGGAVGGSKSTSLLFYTLRACMRFPGLQAFWFRRSFPELEHSVLRLLARYGYAKALGCTWRADTHELRFPSGSALTFSHAKNVQEASAFLSAEINLLLIDERTTLLPDVVDMLYTRVRSGQADVPCLGVRSATNPGEIGHSRVLAEFVEATGHGEFEILDANQRRRIFVQARAMDTPQLGEEYVRNLAGLPEKLRKAYLEGDWTVFAGQVFSEWRYDRHVMQAFTLPESWVRYQGVDWGHRNPWCALTAAVDEDGRVYFFRELYGTGIGETEQATSILAAEAGEPVAVRYADDAMWAMRGEQKTLAAVFAENGVHLTPAGKGPGSRITRVQRMRSYLAEGLACPYHRSIGWATCPMLHVFPACENLIRTLPTLPHAKTGNPEDVDTNAEDHAYDAASYMLINLGTGAEFLAGDEPASSLAAELGPWEQRGNFAYRPDEREPEWGTGDEDTSMRGMVQRSPFG
jgi:hypothetical protein